MKDAVPDIFLHLDYWATHSYPASGIGYGFNVPYDQGLPGLLYYQRELSLVNRRYSTYCAAF
jgi:hypothetical protein